MASAVILEKPGSVPAFPIVSHNCRLTSVWTYTAFPIPRPDARFRPQDNGPKPDNATVVGRGRGVDFAEQLPGDSIEALRWGSIWPRPWLALIRPVTVHENRSIRDVAIFRTHPQSAGVLLGHLNNAVLYQSFDPSPSLSFRDP